MNRRPRRLCARCEAPSRFSGTELPVPGAMTWGGGWICCTLNCELAGSPQLCRPTWRTSGARRDDMGRRLDLLYAQLRAGRISPVVQAHVENFARALASGDQAEAGRLCKTLCGQHWREHKDWLMGLMGLLSLI